MPKKTSDLSPDFEKVTANVLATTKKELQAAAKAHRVKIELGQVIYGSFANITIVLAPIAGIEKYKDADFEMGAPIHLVIVKSTKKGEIPNGAYVVKAQHGLRATSGKAIFTDSTGTVVARRNLIVRTAKQSAVLFPEVYSDSDPQNIPHVTSWHCFPKSSGGYYVDCAGWIPYRVLYY
jgi:hypothetical protein